MSLLSFLMGAKKEGKNEDDALLEYCSKLEGQVAEQQTTISTLNTEANAHKEKTNVLQAEVERLQAEANTNKATIEASTNEHTNNMQSLRDELETLKAENGKLMTANKELAEQTGKGTFVATSTNNNPTPKATTAEDKAVEAHFKAMDLLKSGLFN